MSIVVPMSVGERYRLCERLGTGGVGQVWRAEDTVLDRPVAVKLLRPEHAESEEYRERLRLEARHLAALSHPRLAGVYDYGDGEGDQLPYLVMELIEGDPLSALLARERTLPPGRVVDLVTQAADGLACVHAAGLVHRDIKPANLLVRPDGGLKITDFGIARGAETLRLTRTGQVIGTPLYLSPEQAAGYGVAPPGDVYSLGVIAWECLAGRPPFGGEDVLAVALAHRDRPLPPLPDSVPEPVRTLVQVMTAKDPEARPDAATLAEWARRLQDDPAVTAAPSGPVVASDEVHPAPDITPDARDVSAPPHRRPLLLGVGAVAFAALAGASGWALGNPSGDKAASARAAVSAPTPAHRTATLDPARYYGKPLSAVAETLRRMGLRVRVRDQVVPGRPAGTVVGMTPSGEIPVGTTVTIYAARTPPSPSSAPHRAARPAPGPRESPDRTRAAGERSHGKALGKRDKEKGSGKEHGGKH
ncbi:MAG: serine/threonine-protein kinase [Actinoallomurus sp.]